MPLGIHQQYHWWKQTVIITGPLEVYTVARTDKKQQTEVYSHIKWQLAIGKQEANNTRVRGSVVQGEGRDHNPWEGTYSHRLEGEQQDVQVLESSAGLAEWTVLEALRQDCGQTVSQEESPPRRSERRGGRGERRGGEETPAYLRPC